MSNSSVWLRAFTRINRPFNQPSDTRSRAGEIRQFVAEIHRRGEKTLGIGNRAGQLQHRLMALCHQPVVFRAASQVEEFEVTSHQLHRQQPLAGALEVQTSRDNRGYRHDVGSLAQQCNEAILRFSLHRSGVSEIDCAVLTLQNARFYEILKSIQGSGSGLGVAFILPDVGQRFKRQILIGSFDDKARRFCAGDGNRHGRQQIV